VSNINLGEWSRWIFKEFEYMRIMVMIDNVVATCEDLPMNVISCSRKLARELLPSQG
jgi:hypothetical protein